MTRPNEHDWEDDCAKRLEAIHQQLIAVHDERAPAPASTSSDPEMASAEYVLRIIEHLRRNPVPSTADATRETPLVSDLETGEGQIEFSQANDDVIDWLRAELKQGDAIAHPQTTGRFDIKQLLGRGGFGLVFLAYDSRLEREVALKIPGLDVLLTGNSSERFLREAKAAAMLSHPGIVTVYDAGFIGPAAYLANEYVPGPNLAQWLARQSVGLSVNDAAEVVAALASAVQHAHSRGVIHRDLKPSNIQVHEGRDSPASLAERVKITDFGLARITTSNEQFTVSGAVLGTPAYMAPELARGEATRAGAAVDVYSLGAILYELLTGVPPHAKASLAATLRAVEMEEPVAPRRIKASISRDLEAICLCALDKSPARRYRSAYELQDDLERYLDGRPIRARRAGMLARGMRWSKRNPAMAGMFAGVMVMMITAIAALATMLAQAERDRHVILAERQRVARSLGFAEQAVDQLLNEVQYELAEFPAMDRIRSRLLERALGVQQQIVGEQDSHPGSRLQLVRALRRVGQIQYVLGNNKESESAFVRSVALARQIQDETDTLDLDAVTEYLTAVQGLSSTLRSMGQGSEALALVKNAVAECDTYLSETPFELDLWSAIWDVRQELGELTAALSPAEAVAQFRGLADCLAMIMIQETGLDEHGIDRLRVQWASTQNSLGISLREVGQPEQALEAYSESLSTSRDLLDRGKLTHQQQSRMAATLVNLGNFRVSRQEFAAAGAHYADAVEIMQALIAENPHRPRHKLTLGAAWLGQGIVSYRSSSLDQTLVALTAALSVYEQAQAQHPEYAHIWQDEIATVNVNRVNALTALSRFDEALQTADAVIAHRRQRCQDEPARASRWSELALALSNQGSTFAQMDRIGEALDCWYQALGHHRVAMENQSQNPSFSSRLMFDLRQIVRHELLLREFEAAAHSLGQWRELPKTTVEYALDLAQLAASLIRAELAELELDSVDQAPPDIRLRWAELADAAFDQLNWAVGQSSFDRSVLDTESRDWHPLTDDTRWDALLWDNGTSM